MLDQDTIEQQKELLNQHRRRLALLFQQQARLGDYAPPHIVLEIEDTQTAIRELKESLSSAGIAVEDEPNDHARPSVVTSSHLTPQERRNRSRMLQKVRDFWVKGVLENSLHGAALIELGMEYKPDAVQHPWDMVIQQADQSKRSIPPGSKIIEVFDELGGELLILGEPGSGKTTTLLELARELIRRAEQDDSYPIPVVFNLSSWAEKRKPLADWLVDELNTKYDIPRNTGESWVNAGQVLPLLDGLDEVVAEQRVDCVEAINKYRLKHGLIPLAVCSRVADYEALNSQLRLADAIVVQPLTPQQVDDYLVRAGQSLAGVRVGLRSDAQLGELLSTPLMLSIVILASKDQLLRELEDNGIPDDYRQVLFDGYIRAMLHRRGFTAQYSSQQTLHWLSWLAEQMVRHKETLFYIERVQPDWLPQRRRRWYSFRVTLISGLLGGFIIGLIIVLFGGFLGSLLLGAAGVAIALIVGIMGFGIGMIGGLLGGLVNILRRETKVEQITVVEKLQWSLSKAQSVFTNKVVSRLRLGLRIGLIGGVVFGLLLGLFAVTEFKEEPVYWIVRGFAIGLASVLIIVMLVALILGLVEGLSMGWKEVLSGVEISLIEKPNQGILLSARSALYRVMFDILTSALLGVLIGGLISGILLWQGNEVTDGLAGGMGGGMMLGLLTGMVMGLPGVLEFGGRAVLQHYILRWLLYRGGSLPLRLVPFLDYCAERIFLRKVGGGYIFIHRMLMEYFAELDTEQESNATTPC